MPSFQNRAPSVSFANFASVKLAGGWVCKFAIGPSPLPLAPWQGAQLLPYTCFPVAREPASAGIGFFLWTSRAGIVCAPWVVAGGRGVVAGGPAAVTHAETPPSATPAAILQAEGRREAAFRDAEAREREAEAEARATAMVSEAIARGDVNAINYFVAQKYVEAFAELARSPQQRTVIVPAEMGALVGTIAGIGEMVSLAKDQNSAATPPVRPAPPLRPAGGSVPPSA